jgi:hypothetical protein
VRFDVFSAGTEALKNTRLLAFQMKKSEVITEEKKHLKANAAAIADKAGE